MSKNEFTDLLMALFKAAEEHGIRIGQGKSTHDTFVRAAKAMAAVERVLSPNG